MSRIHDLINYERKKRGIPTVYWSREIARLAQSRANHCAKVGRLVHSNRFAFQGGENLAEGGENFTPRAIVDCWLGSKAGHREYLLSPRAKKAGVGISKSKGKTYVAWAFSDEPASYPDCPYFKPPRPKRQKPKKERVPLRMKFQGIRKSSQIQKTFARLFLNLLVLAGLGFLIRHSYLLFTQPTAPLKNSIILLIGITVWILLIRLLRKKYRWTKPSFKLTTFSVVAILLILTFAGVQPLAGYKDSLIESYRVAQAERAAQAQAEEAARAAQEEAETPAPTPTPTPAPEPMPPEETEFDRITSKLTSPELIRSYMEENFDYDLEKYQRFLAGEDWGWDTPKEVFGGKKTNCGGYAIFALYCLLKNGYEYDSFENNKSDAAVILGCWNSNVPNYRDVHTVLLYVRNGLFYTIDLDRIRGSFGTIEEAATASLSTWTVCYFYDTTPWITKTVKRSAKVPEEIKLSKELRIGLEVVELVNTIREERGSSKLAWDDKLYEYSLTHAKNMAAKGSLFHTGISLPYAENAWGGEGSKSWGAQTIVNSWMNSKMHRTWLLCPNLKHVAVGVAYSTNGMYASWTFWRNETTYSDWWYQYSSDNPPEWWY